MCEVVAKNWGRPARSLTTPKRRLWRQVHDATGMSKAHFYRLLQHGRLGATVYKGRRVGTCPWCYSGDRSIGPRFEKAYLDAEADVLQICPEAFRHFYPPNISYPRAESLKHMKAWIEAAHRYISEGHAEWLAKPVGFVALGSLVTRFGRHVFPLVVEGHAASGV